MVFEFNKQSSELIDLVALWLVLNLERPSGLLKVLVPTSVVSKRWLLPYPRTATKISKERHSLEFQQHGLRLQPLCSRVMKVVCVLVARNQPRHLIDSVAKTKILKSVVVHRVSTLTPFLGLSNDMRIG